MSYDPGEPRDPKGKWTGGGVVGAVAAAIERDLSGAETSIARALTEQQSIDLKDYAEGGYQELNGHLNNPEKTDPSAAPYLNSKAKRIDAAINKSTLKSDITVYRGITHPKLAANAEKVIGRTLDDPGFMSTTVHPKVAENFAGFGAGGLVLAIKAKAGTKALNMEHFKSSGNANEGEVLFGRGSKIKITHVDRSGRLPVIHAEFV